MAVRVVLGGLFCIGLAAAPLSGCAMRPGGGYVIGLGHGGLGAADSASRAAGEATGSADPPGGSLPDSRADGSPAGPGAADGDPTAGDPTGLVPTDSGASGTPDDPATGMTAAPEGAQAGGSALPPSDPADAGFPPTVAVACAGRPAAEQVLTTVRAVPDLLPPSAGVTFRAGPLCAGTWQYSVLGVAGREPLQVLTRGAPGQLVFVTAGTNVCTVEIMIAAPPGILTAARC